MPGATKLLTSGGGAVTIQPASSIASDVTVQVPSVAGTVLLKESSSGMQVPAFSAYLPSPQNVSSGTPTKVALSAEEFDTANCFDSTTNYRFTPNVAGYYQVTFTVGGNSSSTALVASIYKNGSTWKQSIWAASAGTGVSISLPVMAIMYMNGTTDYIEFYGQTNGGTQLYGAQNYTFAMAALVRAA